MAIIMDNLPFNALDNKKYLSKALTEVINPQIRLPNYQSIVNKWLDECYLATKAKVDMILANERHLNFITDESSNIRRERIINLCVQVPDFGAFYAQSEAIKDETLNISFLTNWVSNSMATITKNGSSIINSLITDTCNTQRAVGKEISLLSSFNPRIFWVPCDSHGLQLLVKDTIEIPQFSQIMDIAQDLVVKFSTSHKQLARLRVIMTKLYGQPLALALSVITRWGTQLALLKSVIRSQYAIMEFFSSLPIDAKKTFESLSKTVKDLEFWKELKFLQDLLSPIDEAIKMSESDHSCICYVVMRWKNILKELTNVIKSGHQSETQKALLLAKVQLVFFTRFKTQTSPIHYLAYLINPMTMPDNSIPDFTPQEMWQQVHYFLIEYCQPTKTVETDDLDSKKQSKLHASDKAMSDLLNMRNYTSFFSKGNTVWRLSNDIKAFWIFVNNSLPELGEIATRLARTPATSVPSERSFSLLNLTQSKLRNRLRNDRVDKLQYIIYNERLLKKLSFIPTSEEDMVGLENALLSIEIE